METYRFLYFSRVISQFRTRDCDIRVTSDTGAFSCAAARHQGATEPAHIVITYSGGSLLPWRSGDIGQRIAAEGTGVPRELEISSLERKSEGVLG